jgi:hypothetical protein
LQSFDEAKCQVRLQPEARRSGTLAVATDFVPAGVASMIRIVS